MTNIFEGRTYILILIACFLSLLAIFLVFYICNKYVASRKTKNRSRTSTLTTVDGSLINYDTLRLVYNTTIEHQQNGSPTTARNSDDVYVPCDVTDGSGQHEQEVDKAENVFKMINFVQPSPYAQRVGSRAVSECSESYSSEIEDDAPTNKVSRDQKLSRLRDMGLGKISVSLFLNRSSSTFRVNIIQWLNAGSVCLKHAVSPYIKVSLQHLDETINDVAESATQIEDEIEHDTWREKSDGGKTFLTKTKCKENPVFDEEFSFGVRSEEELRNSFLLLYVCDFDKFSRQVVVGKAEIKIKDYMEVVGLAEGSGELCFDAEEHNEEDLNKGEILYSLQHFPMKGRINFMLVKAKDLSINEDDTSIAIKVSLLFGQKIAKTHKFEYIGTTSEMRNPEFNQTCSLEVPSEMFQHAHVRLRLYAYSAMKKRLIGKTPTRMESDDESCAAALTQWNEMAAKPRVAALY